MTSLDQKLQDWIIEELHLLFEGRLKTIPKVSALSRLNAGKNKRVWNYIIQHVRSRHATEKIRRILKAKRIESEQGADFKSSTYIADPDLLRQKITLVNEKCIFLTSSVSHIEDKIWSIEEFIRELRNDIDKIYQRSAFLDLLTMKYKEKNRTLISLQKQLSFNKYNRFPSEKVNKIPHSVVLSLKEDKDNSGLDYLLGQVLSIVMKKLCNEDFEPSAETVKKRIDQKLNSISLSDLIYYLKHKAKISCGIVLKNAATDVESKESCKHNQTLSQKQLQDMKLSHVQSVFNATKVKKETYILTKLKDSLVEGKVKSMMSSENEEFPTLQKLFKVVLENEALNESIKYFEETLYKVQNDNNAMQEKYKQQILTTQDVESVMKTFYKDFDLMWYLLKFAPSGCQEITKFLSFLLSYAHGSMFTTMTPDLQHYSFTLVKELKSRMVIFWSTCNQNSIHPSMCYPELPESLALYDATNLQRFYNMSMIARKIKNVKEMLREHQEDEFQFKSDNTTTVQEQYNKMMDSLKEIDTHLKFSDGQLEQCSELTKRMCVAVTDWWEQGAQYIHKISCEDKTLKMWQDILQILSDYQ